MKQAILILAHTNFEQLKKLIQLLDYEKFDIYIHIDKKCKINKDDIKNICKESKVYIYSEFYIKWADFSQTECEIFLLKKAIKNNNYEYYHLISGLDLPLKKSKEIHDFFHLKDREFVHFESKKIAEHKLDFIKYYYPLLKFNSFKKSKVLKGLNKFLILFQKVFRINRIKNKEIEFYTGANWFSITNDFANYLVENETFIKETFKGTRCSDEMFVQTLLMNSKFKDKLYNNDFNNDYQSCKRYIDWNRGKPYIWTVNEFDELINSNYIFARKFDSTKDNEIIFKIEKYLKGE